MTKNLLTLIIGLALPCKFKNWLLRRLGHQVNRQAWVGIILLTDCSKIVLEANSRISHCNSFRGLKNLTLAEGSRIGAWNWVTAVKEFRQESELAGNLVLMNGAAITSRHYIDASGGVIVGKFTTIGGVRSTILSHGIDFASNKQGCAPVIVGNYSFISTNCVLVKGAVLPSSSVLGANSLLTAKFNANSSPGLYGGSPAKHLREYAGEYFSRSEAYVKVEKKTAI